MPLFNGTADVKFFFTVDAVDAEQAEDFMREMVLEDAPNSDTFTVYDIKEVK